METSREQRLARNEAFFREVNESIRVAAGSHSSDGHVYAFLCECADTGCSERVSLSLAEYELVRADGKRFVIAPGHLVPAIETVVAHSGDHTVIEKLGRAGETAVELDPRADE